MEVSLKIRFKNEGVKILNLVDFMKKRSKKIEDTKEELFELQHGLEGGEVIHKGKETIIMEVDWNEKEVLLNYDDVNFEWVSFE